MRNTRILPALVIVATAASADDATIESVSASNSGGAWTFSVTLRHADTGWDDYADGWRVVDENGAELGMRVLFHPHVNEQPFTRTLSGVQIPDGLTTVYVEARTNVDGWGDARFEVDVSR